VQIFVQFTGIFAAIDNPLLYLFHAYRKNKVTITEL